MTTNASSGALPGSIRISRSRTLAPGLYRRYLVTLLEGARADADPTVDFPVPHLGVEQSLGTLMLQRRLVRDYESNPASSESRVYWAITGVMARRLTGAATPTWRGA